MSDTKKKKKVSIYTFIKWILFLLFLVSVPFGCFTSVFAIDAVPASLMPDPLDFIFNLFETEFVVQNETDETLYITPITTTYPDPRVILQYERIRQRDYPLKPKGKITLKYDSADLPLAGIVICRSDDECRVMLSNHLNDYSITSFDDLSEVDPSWLHARAAHPKISFGIVYLVIISLLPILLYVGWARVRTKEFRYHRGYDE